MKRNFFFVLILGWNREAILVFAQTARSRQSEWKRIVDAGQGELARQLLN
jgi:hypothetical protein